MSGYYLQNTVKKYTTAYKVFTHIKKKFKYLHRISVHSSTRKCIRAINNIVAEYDEDFANKSGYFREFISRLEEEYTLNIFSLNYDSWAEQSLSKYCDGFQTIPGCKGCFERFSIAEYRKACRNGQNTVAHLHGSILYGDADLKLDDINRFAYEDKPDSLYKYESYEVAEDYRQRHTKSNSINQAGETIINSNIITGLMKTDKLLRNSLIEYEHHLYQALTENENLLIVGYGFLDQYINSMLWQFQSSHYDSRKVMLITKAEEDTDWNLSFGPPLSPDEMTIFTDLMFKDQVWFRGVRFSQVDRGYYSKDKMVAIYTCGLKTVTEKYLDKVIKFLKE